MRDMLDVLSISELRQYQFITEAVIPDSCRHSFASAGLPPVTGVPSGIAGALASASSQTRSPVAPYDLDVLFRSPHPDQIATPADGRAETARILAHGAATGDVPTADRTYLAELVALSTGITSQEAQRRVDAAISQAKASAQKARELADAARKAAAETSIFTALSMLVGAFIASIAASVGSHQREHL
jgi:hypothetical protein